MEKSLKFSLRNQLLGVYRHADYNWENWENWEPNKVSTETKLVNKEPKLAKHGSLAGQSKEAH